MVTLPAATLRVGHFLRKLTETVVLVHWATSASRRDELAVLTRTEKVVADLVARGFNNGEIAEQLVLAEGTIKNHISALLRKLDARDRTVLALRLAKALGL